MKGLIQVFAGLVLALSFMANADLHYIDFPGDTLPNRCLGIPATGARVIFDISQLPVCSTGDFLDIGSYSYYIKSVQITNNSIALVVDQYKDGSLRNNDQSINGGFHYYLPQVCPDGEQLSGGICKEPPSFPECSTTHDGEYTVLQCGIDGAVPTSDHPDYLDYLDLLNGEQSGLSDSGCTLSHSDELAGKDYYSCPQPDPDPDLDTGGDTGSGGDTGTDPDPTPDPDSDTGITAEEMQAIVDNIVTGINANQDENTSLIIANQDDNTQVLTAKLDENTADIISGIDAAATRITNNQDANTDSLLSGINSLESTNNTRLNAVKNAVEQLNSDITTALNPHMPSSGYSSYTFEGARPNYFLEKAESAVAGFNAQLEEAMSGIDEYKDRFTAAMSLDLNTGGDLPCYTFNFLDTHKEVCFSDYVNFFNYIGLAILFLASIIGLSIVFR